MNKKNESVSNLIENSNITDLSGLTNSVKERIYERAKSPFVSTFMIAWAAINFRAIYALITSDSYSEAYQIIDLKVWIGPIETVSMIFLIPITSTFIYLAAVPFLEELAVKLWASGKIKVRSARAAIEDTAALEGESILYFSNYIASLKQDNLSKLSQLTSEHSSETQKIKNRLEYLRNKSCRSIYHQDDARQTLHNMDEIGRDILWIANQVQASKSSMISSKYIFDEMKIMHPDINIRAVNQTITYLSSECYILQDIGDIVTDVGLQLSTRGKFLAEIMAAEGISPKFIKQKATKELLEILSSRSIDPGA